MQPWLNQDLYTAIKKQKESVRSPAFVTFINKLKERGVSDKAINEMLKEEGTNAEEFDKAEVLAAPWLTKEKKVNG